MIILLTVLAILSAIFSWLIMFFAQGMGYTLQPFWTFIVVYCVLFLIVKGK